MARKTADGEKFSKKTKARKNGDLNVYSQKTLRIREEMLTRRKEISEDSKKSEKIEKRDQQNKEVYVNTHKNESNMYR